MVRIEGRVGAGSFISTYQDELRGETKRKKKDYLLFFTKTVGKIPKGD